MARLIIDAAITMNYLLFLLLLLSSFSRDENGVLQFSVVVSAAAEEDLPEFMTALDENDDDEFDDDDDDGAGDEPPKPKVGTNTWIITGTTLEKKPPEAATLIQGDRTRVPPYVHWTCHAQKRMISNKDRMACCQRIFDMMVQDPQAMCYLKGACAQDAAMMRSPWIYHCAEQLAIVPTTINEELHHQPGPDANAPLKRLTFEPQFTIVEQPSGSIPPDVSPGWRQYIMFTSYPGAGWFYGVKSPMHIAIDPFTHEQPKVEHDERMANGAKLVTRVKSHKDDEDERILSHVLKLKYNETVPGWTRFRASLRVLIFVPEGIKLPKKDAIGNCGTTCGGLVDQEEREKREKDDKDAAVKKDDEEEKCHDFAMCNVTLSEHSKSDVDNQEAFSVTIHLDAGKTDPTSSGTCEILWRTRLLMDDGEDDIILAEPVFQDGQIVFSTKEDGIMHRRVHAVLHRLKPLTTNSEEEHNLSSDEL